MLPGSAMGRAGASSAQQSPALMVIKAVSVTLGKYQGWGFLGLVFQQVEQKNQ